MNQRLVRALLVAVCAAALMTLGAGYWHVEAPYPNDHERFGVGLAGPAHQILDYDLESLGAAWYLNWGVAMDPPHPNAAPFMQTIRLKEGVSRVSDDRLRQLVRANPGATWQIGNEPDSIWLDNTEPEAYAEVYHHLYHVIKWEDPTARVANGGLVQATPLRMAYLDRVWETYQEHYGVTMPVDVWIVHGFILRERPGSWGAEIPPGMRDQAHLGMRYDLRDHDDLTIFADQIRRFRQWMADHGQRDKPLIVNEYGILMPADIRDEDGEDFGADRVIAFMEGSFDYFLSATDPDIGYPADDNRLVQKWAWYSLDDKRYDADGRIIGWGYNGDLFTGAFTKTMTALGQAYAAYVHDEVGIGEPYTDLAPLTLHADLSTATWGQTGTITLTGEIINHGRKAADDVVVGFWEGDSAAEGTLIGVPQSLPEVPGRYEGSATARVAWTTTISGSTTVWMVVDPDGQIEESDETNNVRTLPLDLRGNLTVDGLTLEPRAPLLEGDTVTVTARALVTNVSQVRGPAGAEVSFFVAGPRSGDTGGTEPAHTRTLGALAPGETQEVTTTFSFTAAGAYTLTVRVDHELLQADDENRSVEVRILVATDRLLLPIVARSP